MTNVRSAEAARVRLSCNSQFNFAHLLIAFALLPLGINAQASFTAGSNVQCGQLSVNLHVDQPQPQCTYTWKIQIGNNVLVQNGPNSGIDLFDIDTYDPQTASASIVLTADCNGSVTTSQQTLILPSGIFIGKDGETRSLSGSLSPFSGQPLLPGTGAQNKQVYIGGTLLVDRPGVTFEFRQCTLLMKPCASIEIKALLGNTLQGLKITQQSLLYNPSECNGLWRGIAVEPNMFLQINNSSIQNALFAVQPFGSSKIDLSESTFTDNFIGVNIKDAQFQAPIIVNFSGNTFSTVHLPLRSLCSDLSAWYNNYRPDRAPSAYSPDKTFAGFSAQNALCAFPTPSNDNIFESLANGIILSDVDVPANGSIRRCRFLNLGGNFSTSGNGIYFIDNGPTSNTFYQDGLNSTMPNYQNCVVGINILSGQEGTYINLGNNQMNPVSIGININARGGALGKSGTSNSKIYATYITASRLGIKYLQDKPLVTYLDITGPYATPNVSINTTTGRGVLLESLAPYNFNLLHQISLNEFNVNLGNGVSGVEVRNMNGVGLTDVVVASNSGTYATRNFMFTECKQCAMRSCISNDLATGSDAEGTWVQAGGDNIFKNNKFFATKVGMHFTGVSPAIITCNKFRPGLTLGLLYDPNANTGQQNYRNNCWAPSIPVWAKFSAPTAFWASQSSFKVPNPAYNEPLSNCWEAPTANNLIDCPYPWFTAIGLPTPPCEETIFESEAPKSKTLFDTLSALTDWESPALNWWHRRLLSAKLKTYPDLLDNDLVLQSFVNTQDGYSVGEMANLAAEISETLTMSISDQKSQQNNRRSIIKWEQDVAQIDVDWHKSTDEDERNRLMAMRLSLLDSIDQLRQQSAQLTTAHAATIASAVPVLALKNSQIATSGDFDTNEKTLNRIWINTYLAGAEVNSTSQRDSIATIAVQCPDSGGAAVYWARSWYSNLKEEDVSFESSCTEERASFIAQSNPPVFRALPNPASDQIVVTKSDNTPLLPETSVNLYNHLGHLILKRIVEDDNTECLIPVATLPPGIYLVQIQSANAAPTTLKIVVVH